MTKFSELLEKRRSIRDFEDKDVSLEVVRKIIKDSCLAPSAGNGQPWEFIIVNNREVIRGLSDESKKNILSYIEKNPGSPTRKYEAALRNAEYNVFYNAPCLVYIGGSKQVRTVHVDCTLAACYFMFSAIQSGLGTCWIGFGTHIQDPDLRELIGLPRDHIIVAPIILGYPKHIPAPPERTDPRVLKIVS